MGKNRESEVLVLGSESAAAAEAERRHRVNALHLPSPLERVRYTYRSWALSLLRPTPQPADATIAALCDRFAASNEAGRRELRDTLRMNDFYLLLCFATRSALFAIREQRTEALVNGFRAVAMIEAARVDWRDIVVALGMLTCAATRIKVNPETVVGAAMALADPTTAEFMARFRNPSLEDCRLRSWGYGEIETEAGIGFIQGGFGRSKPRCDLLGISLEMADLLSRDRYSLASLSCGEPMPRVWLEQQDNTALDAALAKFRTGVHLDMAMKRTPSVRASAQHFAVWLLEMKTTEAASQLLAVARAKTPTFFCKIELAAGPVFCLVIARSWMGGVAAHETPESLARFAAPLGAILNQRMRA